MTTAKQRIADLSDLPPGGVLRVEVDGSPICLARVESGEVYALRDQCSHEQFPLSDGEVVGSEIECPIHLARFDLRTGAASGQPAKDPVQSYPATVEGDAIYVDV